MITEKLLFFWATLMLLNGFIFGVLLATGWRMWMGKCNCKAVPFEPVDVDKLIEYYKNLKPNSPQLQHPPHE